MNENTEWRVLWLCHYGGRFFGYVTIGGGFCVCVTMGEVFCGCVMIGGGFDCVGGGLSTPPRFLGFFDASILKIKIKNNYKTYKLQNHITKFDGKIHKRQIE